MCRITCRKNAYDLLQAQKRTISIEPHCLHRAQWRCQREGGGGEMGEISLLSPILGGNLRSKSTSTTNFRCKRSMKIVSLRA